MIEIIEYDRSYQKSFEELNRAWITQYFKLDKLDIEVLSKPEIHIISKGGYIFIAKFNDSIVGTCALIKLDGDTYELSKMTVEETYRGKGIGNLLMEAVLEKAKKIGAKKLELYTQKFLPEAINLYKKFGFQEISKETYKYSRADTYMVKLIAEE